MRVLIIGAGGHASVVADILLRMRYRGEAVEPVGYLDDNPSLTGKKLLGLPVLGKTSDIGKLAHEAVIMAIGDNATRRRFFELLSESGERFFTARHPNAVIAPDVTIGPGTVVCAGAIVNPQAVISSDVILNTSCSVDHHCRIDDHAHVAPGVRLGGAVVVGEGTLVGIASTVIGPCSIGPWCLVRAGSVVHQNERSGVVSLGQPARLVGKQAQERGRKRGQRALSRMSKREQELAREGVELIRMAPPRPSVGPKEPGDDANGKSKRSQKPKAKRRARSGVRG